MRQVSFLLFFLFVAASVGESSDEKPWYFPIFDLIGRTTKLIEGDSCKQKCSTTLDCEIGLSCYQATATEKGCCLMTLKPNETGCVVEEQCKQACESTICDKTRSPSRCLCEKGRHFLFNKCWKKCPEFAFPDPIVDERGFSSCQLKMDSIAALDYMRRQKRYLRSNFC